MILEINRVVRTSNHVNRLTYVRNFRDRAYLALPRDQHRLRSRVASAATRARTGGRYCTLGAFGRFIPIRSLITWRRAVRTELNQGETARNCWNILFDVNDATDPSTSPPPSPRCRIAWGWNPRSQITGPTSYVPGFPQDP